MITITFGITYAWWTWTNTNNTNVTFTIEGAANNNSVYFANYCWKIVRTTETGGIKMIYNGQALDDSQCGTGTNSKTDSTIGISAFNTNYDNAKYVGYTYNNAGIETDSTIKGVIDTWYQTHLLTNYDSYIEDTVYCNDRAEATASERTQIETLYNITLDPSDIYYKSTIRYALANMPSLECTNNSDKYTKSNLIGNGKLTYPIGLLTMDEVWLAGEDNNYGTSSNSTYYLNNGYNWLLLSPASYTDANGAAIWVLPSSVGLAEDRVSHDKRVRPVITLKPDYNSFDYGNGTGANPYRFVAEMPEFGNQ